MAQSLQLVDVLKKNLKSQGLTYRDIATRLRLSEASIKRMFSEKNFTLKRLEQLCQCIDLELSDLLRLLHEQEHQLSQLSEEQEQEIVNDLTLLLITVCVLNRWTLADILASYKLTEAEAIRYLARLDRLKIIELLPKNRIKLLVAPNFAWRKNGPIQQFFHSKIEKDFFSSGFDKDHECLFVINAMLSPSSNVVFQRKLEKLVREFNELNDVDAGLPLEQRNGTTVLMAVREWQYGIFQHLRK